MLKIGVQSKNIVNDLHPDQGFAMMRQAGFSCADFSLNEYLPNTLLYQSGKNRFFDRSIQELEQFFLPHKLGAQAAGITINQMHMPYPVYIPGVDEALNQYLWNEVAPKSMRVCAFFGCPFIVIHGFKLAHYLGSEDAEWEKTERLIHAIAPMAKESGITVCIENLYNSMGGHMVEGPCCDVRKAVERIDRINDQYHAQVLGFCLDTGHANLVGLDFEHVITTLDYRLKVLHIHDNDGAADLHQIPYTFTKNRENRPSTDWDGLVRGLGRIHFNRVLSFETAPALTTFPEEMKTDVLEFIYKIGSYLAEQITSFHTLK